MSRRSPIYADLRAAFGWSIDRMAAEVGVSHRTWQRWEDGLAEPDRLRAVRLNALCDRAITEHPEERWMESVGDLPHPDYYTCQRCQKVFRTLGQEYAHRERLACETACPTCRKPLHLGSIVRFTDGSVQVRHGQRTEHLTGEAARTVRAVLDGTMPVRAARPDPRVKAGA